MHPVGKILFGAILMIGGVAWILKYALGDFITVLNGIVPPLVFLIGVFIVWLELDELRIERELKTEEKKTRRRKKR